jgi:hypothetical protein
MPVAARKVTTTQRTPAPTSLEQGTEVCRATSAPVTLLAMAQPKTMS